MQALAEQRLQPGGRLGYHLDRCLDCRACERVCPSEVRYGRLIDAARALEAVYRPPRTPIRLQHRRLLDRLVAHRRRLKRTVYLLRLYQRSGLRWMIRHSGLLALTGGRRLDRLLPEIPPLPRWRNNYRPAADQRGNVALFLGCIGQFLDQDALRASIELLTACGYGVHIPDGQTCCGALHLHGGDLARAAALSRQNLEVFNALAGETGGLDAILYTASGCGATLAEYGEWPASGAAGREAERFEAPVRDLCSFLEDRAGLESLQFAPWPSPVAVHDPCTLRNVIGTADAPYRLLRRIPGLTTAPLPGNGRCCGAAGSYLLTQPAMADALLEDKLDALQQSGVKTLVTSNIGCALFLASGIRSRGLGIELMHPVTLLARQHRSGLRSSRRSSSSPSRSAPSGL